MLALLFFKLHDHLCSYIFTSHRHIATQLEAGYVKARQLLGPCQCIIADPGIDNGAQTSGNTVGRLAQRHEQIVGNAVVAQETDDPHDPLGHQPKIVPKLGDVHQSQAGEWVIEQIPIAISAGGLIGHGLQCLQKAKKKKKWSFDIIRKT